MYIAAVVRVASASPRVPLPLFLSSFFSLPSVATRSPMRINGRRVLGYLSRRLRSCLRAFNSLAAGNIYIARVRFYTRDDGE